MIVTLPSGKEMTFTGGAAIAHDFPGMVIDFLADDPATILKINDTIFRGLSHAQLEEFYQVSGGDASESQSHTNFGKLEQISGASAGLSNSGQFRGEMADVARSYGIEKPVFVCHDVPGDAEYHPVRGEWPGIPPVEPEEPYEPPTSPEEPHDPPTSPDDPHEPPPRLKSHASRLTILKSLVPSGHPETMAVGE